MNPMQEVALYMDATSQDRSESRDWNKMVERFLKERVIAGVLMAAMASFFSTGRAQEPPASLKQADADYRAGVSALSRNELNSALTDFEHAVQLAPTAWQAHSALGSVLVRMGRTDDGIRELEKALAIHPGDSSVQLSLALGYEQGGHAAKALPYFAKVEAAAHAEKHPLAVPVLAAYARALAATGQVRAAIVQMKEAAARDPRNSELQDDLGSLYAQKQDWTNAKLAFAVAIQEKPDFAIAHLHLGLALQAEQQPDALREMAKAHELAPGDATIALELGKALANAGQDEQAAPILQRAVELNPASTAAEYQLGLVLERLGRLSEAIPLLQKAEAAHPDDAEILTNLGMALCQAQRTKEAVPPLLRAVELEPENATAHQDLAVAYIQLSQFDDAIVQLRAALKLSPDAAQLHYNLGFALKMQDDAADAIPELEAAEKLNPTEPEAPYLLGVLYMQAGRYADAERELSASLHMRANNGDGWATLGSVYNKLDRLPEAVSALQEAIRQSPAQADPHLTLAAVLAKQNQPAEATEERRKAAELMRAHMNFQRAEVATNSANSLLTSGKVAEAESGFREALSFDADYAEAHEGLAKALDREGKTVEAAAERQRAEALTKAAQP
jgi:protein O-GlcNAc transferase